MTRCLLLAGPVLLALATAACGDATTGATGDTGAASDTTPPPCEDAAGCDDGDPCSADRCDDGLCTHSVAVGAACDDGDACTDGDVCGSNGRCGGATIPLPRPPCATCTCDPASGVTCVAVALGTACDDQDCCSPSSRCAACDPATDPGCPAWEAVCAGTRDGCDDGNACTDDTCACDDDDERVCGHADVADGTACEADPNACTSEDTCQAGHCELGTPLPLDDGDPCTVDRCVKGDVVHDLANSGQCDDGNECTQDDHCALGACVGGPAVECAKPECASSVSCVPGTGCVAVWKPAESVCEDGDACTTVSVCDAAHGCVPSVSVAIDDGDACTVDACDPTTGEVTHLPTPLTCGDDHNPCTVDTCNPATGACGVPVPDGSTVPDADLCDGLETCHDGQVKDGVTVSCAGVTNPCLAKTCNPASGACDLPLADDTPCADDDLCDGAETCLGGVCTEAAPVDCAGVTDPCLERSCNPATGACDLPVDDHTPCADDDLCDGDETCQAGHCTEGPPVDCSGVTDPCIIPQCNIATGACDLAVADATSCADDERCDGDEICLDGVCTDVDPVDCSGVTDPCLVPQCNINTGACDLPVDDDTPCADADLCDGAETCQSGTCTAGAAVDCSAVADPCLLPQCNTATGACDLAVEDETPCADDDLCDGDELCLGGACMDVDPVDCGDVDDPCLVSQCNINTGACDLPVDDDTSCADDDLCDGDEVCLAGVCNDVDPVDCSGVTAPCLQPECNAMTGACDLAVEDGTSCADDDLCDGDEVCMAGLCEAAEPIDCAWVTDPCVLPQCNTATGACDLLADDDTSCADDNLCDGSERCVGGTCQPGEPVRCPDDGHPCTEEYCNPATGGCGALLRTTGLGQAILQPGPGESLDKFVGSVYDSDPLGVRPDLAVGGWGDQYWSQFRFELAGLAPGPVAASIHLYAGPGTYNPSAMWLDRIDAPWTLTTTWAQRPAGTQLATVPPCVANSWYTLDVTDLATAWLSGAIVNWGIRLRPQGTSQQFNSFYSGDYTEDPSLRPYIALTYDCATYPSPCAEGDACTALCEGTPCDDGDPCTSGDTCAGGACVGSGGDCPDDGDPCTAEACTEGGCEHVWTCVETVDGAITYEVVPALDDDGLLHTGGRGVPVGANGSGRAYALRSSDLGVEWGPVQLSAACPNTGSPLPAVHDDFGYVFTNGDWNDGSSDACAALFAKRTDTAALVWNQQPGGPHPRHPIALSDTHAYYGGWAGSIRAFDIATGAITGTMNLAVGSSQGGGLVLTSNDDMIASQNGYKVERWTPAGARVWTSTALKNDLHMTLGDDVVGWNPTSDALIYVDGATGQQVWSAAAPGGNGAILTAADGALYYGHGDGAASVDADGLARWSTPLGASAAAQLLGDDGLFYVRTWSTLFALDTADGAVVWRLDAVSGQVSINGVMTDNGFAGTFGLLAGGDLFGSDYAGRTYRLATAGLDYAAAPWARPRGNRRNSAKIWDVAPLPGLPGTCGLGDGVDDTITRELDGGATAIGDRAALYDSNWSSGGDLVLHGEDLWFATGVSGDCLGRWWGTKTTRFTHDAAGGMAPAGVSTVCEAGPAVGSVNQHLAAGPVVALCYQIHSPTNTTFCGRWDGAPGSWTPTEQVGGGPGSGVFAASDVGFAFAFGTHPAQELSLTRFDGQMTAIGATSLTDAGGSPLVGSWRALAAVGTEWWAVRTRATGPPWPLTLERFDAGGVSLGATALPSIGAAALTASPQLDVVALDDALYGALAVGAEAYLVVMRADGAVGARRVHVGAGELRARLVALSDGAWAMLVWDIEAAQRTVALLRLGCDGTVLEGPREIARNSLVNLRGAALDATGQGLWLTESEQYSGNSHHVWTRRLALP